MEKKFIQKNDLDVIMEHLAERVMKNVDKVSLEVSLKKFCGDMTLEVVVRSNATFKTLSSERYIIIDKLYDDYDLSEDVFDAGLAKWEEEDAELKRAEKTAAEQESEEQEEEETTNN